MVKGGPGFTLEDRRGVMAAIEGIYLGLHGIRRMPRKLIPYFVVKGDQSEG